MEAIAFLTQWTSWLLLVIPAGAGMMVTYYALKKTLSLDLEEKGHCDVRIKQTLKGAIVGIGIAGFITIVKSFYI